MLNLYTRIIRKTCMHCKVIPEVSHWRPSTWAWSFHCWAIVACNNWSMAMRASPLQRLRMFRCWGSKLLRHISASKILRLIHVGMGVDWGREWIPGWAPTHCDIGGGGQGGAKNRPPISQDFRVMIEIPTDFDTRNARAHTHTHASHADDLSSASVRPRAMCSVAQKINVCFLGFVWFSCWTWSNVLFLLWYLDVFGMLETTLNLEIRLKTATHKWLPTSCEILLLFQWQLLRWFPSTHLVRCECRWNHSMKVRLGVPVNQWNSGRSFFMPCHHRPLQQNLPCA